MLEKLKIFIFELFQSLYFSSIFYLVLFRLVHTTLETCLNKNFLVYGIIVTEEDPIIHVPHRELHTEV